MGIVFFINPLLKLTKRFFYSLGTATANASCRTWYKYIFALLIIALLTDIDKEITKGNIQ